MGTGIKKIRRIMSEAGLKPPRFKFTNFFTIIFSRPSALRPAAETTQKKVTEKVTENQRRILTAMISNKYITASELAEGIGILERKTKENIKKLKEKGLLKRIGPDKGGHWEVMQAPKKLKEQYGHSL